MIDINKTKIPDKALEVLNILKENGFESYICGGAVRDNLLGREVKDWDITTSALPEQVISLFFHVIPTGLQHGTVTVLINQMPIEVTTFRTDGNYSDNCRPDSVQFGVSVFDDVLRRDFTINSMLFDGEQIVDYCAGMNDLENGIIRTVGYSWSRYQEDSLRMMRAIRFSCQLGFIIEEKTFEGIKSECERIKNVSWERIKDELIKILMSDRPVQGIELLQESGLLKYILPELELCVGFDHQNYHHRKNVFEHILKVLDVTDNRLNLRLSALLHDIAKPQTFSIGEDGIGHFYGHHVVGADMTVEILKRLKFDNETIENVRVLVREHMARYPKLRNGSIKKLINRLGKKNIDDFIDLQIADIIGSKPSYDFDNVIDLKREIKRVLEAKEPLSVKDLTINGYDLIEIGMKPGKEMGEILNNLLEMVLDNPKMNNKEDLINQAKIHLFQSSIFS